jgi:hypothetical protein
MNRIHPWNWEGKITTFQTERNSFRDILKINSILSWVRLLVDEDRQKLDGSSQLKNTFHYLSHIDLGPLEPKKEAENLKIRR